MVLGDGTDRIGGRPDFDAGLYAPWPAIQSASQTHFQQLTMRGAQSAGATTTTTAFTGVLAKDNAMRRQFRLAGADLPA